MAGDAADAATTAADATEEGRRLFAAPCTFVAGIAGEGAMPSAGVPEIAFAGRSNVGKSSLLNALTGRTSLARISRTPGRTRQLNVFDLGGRLWLVDLPGYGYAKAPKAEIAAWTRLMRAYLSGRASLRRVCLLVDARHGLKPADRDMMALLDDAAVNYQAVLTKIDKLIPGTLDVTRRDLGAELARHGAAHPVIAATSSRVHDGIAELRAELAALAAPRGIGYNRAP